MCVETICKKAVEDIDYIEILIQYSRGDYKEIIIYDTSINKAVLIYRGYVNTAKVLNSMINTLKHTERDEWDKLVLLFTYEDNV
jgi:hypothetical protein